MSAKFNRAFLAVAALATLSASWGCVADRPSRNGVFNENQYVRKAFLVRKGTLADYVYLEHVAHWAIGALSVILLVGIGYHVNEIITGLIGVAFIVAAFLSSVLRNRRLAAEGIDTHRSLEEMEHTS
jgi:hypothetical protein